MFIENMVIIGMDMIFLGALKFISYHLVKNMALTRR
jgi:hypothetical protein